MKGSLNHYPIKQALEKSFHHLLKQTRTFNVNFGDVGGFNLAFWLKKYTLFSVQHCNCKKKKQQENISVAETIIRQEIKMASCSKHP